MANALNDIAPTRYSHFNKYQETPFITYIDDGEENFYSDNTDYYQGEFFRVELYTDNKMYDLEERIKSIFRDSGINFQKLPTQYVETEELFVTTFEIKLWKQEE